MCPLWFPGTGGSWQGSALARQPDPDRQRGGHECGVLGELEAQQPGAAGSVVLQPGRVVLPGQLDGTVTEAATANRTSAAPAATGYSWSRAPTVDR